MKAQRIAVALRLDDVGASSKKYEVYSNHNWHYKGFSLSANVLFFKYLPRYRAWGPYREMTAAEWIKVFALLDRHDAKITVGVTATWVDDEEQLIPFPIRFPEEAATLKLGMQEGMVEIANHGLTHCVLRDNAFKPKLFRGNREQHREFWDWLPDELHFDHIQRAQGILENYFETEVVTFIPPGNVFSQVTVDAASQHGLRYLACNTIPREERGITIIGEERVIAFHDREIVLEGLGWLESLLDANKDKDFRFVRELSIKAEERVRVHG